MEQKESSLLTLPPETIANILDYLDCRSLAQFQCVNRQCRDMLDKDPHFWRACCDRIFEPWLMCTHLARAGFASREAAPAHFWRWLCKTIETSHVVNTYTLPRYEHLVHADVTDSAMQSCLLNRSGHTATQISPEQVLLIGGLMLDRDMHYYASDHCLLFNTVTGACTCLENDGTLLRRLRHTTVMLPDNRVMVFGGYDLASRKVISGLQVGRLASGKEGASSSSSAGGSGCSSSKRIVWEVVDTKGPAPSPRCQHVAAILADGYTMLVYGGNPGPSAEPSGVYLLDTRSLTWRVQPVGGADDMIDSFVLGLSIMDTLRRRLLLLGGSGGDMVVRYLDLDTWTWRKADTPVPATLAPRERSSIVQFSKDYALLVAGGSMDSGAPLRDMWRLHLGTLRWTRVVLGDSFEAAGHSLQGGFVLGGYTIKEGQLRTQARVLGLQFGQTPYQHQTPRAEVREFKSAAVPQWPWEPPTF